MLDLHLHSAASDGELRPQDLVSKAAQAGVRTLALTDHDSMAGVAEAQTQAAELGLEFIPGVEISARWREMDVHIVGLNLAADSAALSDQLASQQQRRQERAQQIAAKLAKLGLDDSYAAAAKLSPQGIPARPHFAEVMVAGGMCSNRKQAFQRYLAVGKPAYVKTPWPSMETVIQWITAAKGVAVLAHPARYPLTLTKLETMVTEFSEQGGQGLEVVTATQTRAQIKSMARLVERYGLYGSIGSDFHGAKMPWIQLGRLPPLPENCRSVAELWIN